MMRKLIWFMAGALALGLFAAALASSSAWNQTGDPRLSNP